MAEQSISVFIRDESGDLVPCKWFRKTYSSMKMALSAMAGNTDDGKRQGASVWTVKYQNDNVQVVMSASGLQYYYLVDTLALVRDLNLPRY